jgi:hypothetical protein
VMMTLTKPAVNMLTANQHELLMRDAWRSFAEDQPQLFDFLAAGAG